MKLTDFINGFRYQSFRHHSRACVVCGEDRVLDVHHLNYEELDHSEENIVPLCPTHHRYIHSHWPEETLAKIADYLEKWRQGPRLTGIAEPDVSQIEHKCCHCGEERIVSIVPVDGNEMNVDPTNLVPLCPTHQALYQGHTTQRSLLYTGIEANEVKISVEKYITTKFI
jgi:5-methylcytosine-specific restriction endonuclease McrA